MSVCPGYTLHETAEVAYRGATVLRLSHGGEEVGLAHLLRWTKSVPAQVAELLGPLGCRPGPAEDGAWGLMVPLWLAVCPTGQGHGLHLLAELATYAGRHRCALAASCLVAPGFTNTEALRAWRSSRLRRTPGLFVGDRCAVCPAIPGAGAVAAP